MRGECKNLTQDFVEGGGRSGTGEKAPYRQSNKGVDRRAHLLGDRVDEPDVQVLLGADTCDRGGDSSGHGVRAEEPLPGTSNLSLMWSGPGSPWGLRGWGGGAGWACS